MAGGMPPVTSEDVYAAVMEAGAHPHISLEVSFTEDAIREALRRVASRHTGGKVILRVMED